MSKIWEGIRNLMKTKMFLIIVAAVVVLYIVLFPHTKTTKVNAEISGIFITQQERYLLHTRVEFETSYACLQGTTVKSQTINYRLNGDIKSISISNCDGTYENTQYNKNGTIKSLDSIIFVGGDIRIDKQEYNEHGSLESQITELSGTIDKYIYKYYDSNIMKESNVTRKVFGLKTNENILMFDENSQIIKSTIKNWENRVLITDVKTEYTKGIVSDIDYVDEKNNLTLDITCDETGCILNVLVAENYIVQYNLEDQDYDMFVDGEEDSVKVYFTPINEFNIESVLNQIENKAQDILENQ